MNPSDTATWLPLDGLAPGFDANRAPRSTALSGRTITVVDPRGTRIVHRFADDTVAWDYHPGDGDPIEASSQTDDYEAVLVDDGLYLVQFHHAHLPEEAVSMVLDLRSGDVLTVISVIGEAGQVPRVQQVAVAGRIEEVTPYSAGASSTARAPHPTTELIGRRAFWVYSPAHAYEHIYLSPELYTWQCLAGPERGLADTDACSQWELRPGIHLFAWREKVIPCASVTVADHRSAHALRSHGVLFGLDGTGDEIVHFTFGAHGRLLATTVHPEGFEPSDGFAAVA